MLRLFFVRLLFLLTLLLEGSHGLDAPGERFVLDFDCEIAFGVRSKHLFLVDFGHGVEVLKDGQVIKHINTLVPVVHDGVSLSTNVSQ